MYQSNELVRYTIVVIISSAGTTWNLQDASGLKNQLKHLNSAEHRNDNEMTKQDNNYNIKMTS